MIDLRTAEQPFTKVPRDQWAQITEAHWWYALEVLPPLYFAGGFAMGEPAAHTAEGVPIHCCCVQRGSGYFARELPMDQAAREALHLRTVGAT